ncbi:MAG: hypothetical protein RIS36_2133 [Pseudomonadota bacterium]|jgi:hypothetical protein
MKTSIKHIATLLLFAGVVVTPTFAFEPTSPPDIDLVVGTATSNPSSALPLTELQKIAAQVRGWNVADTNATKSDENGDSTAYEEHDRVEEPQEIKKLDSVFFDYVMAKYIERVRRS